MRPIKCMLGLIWAESRRSSGTNFIKLRVWWRTVSTILLKSFLLMPRLLKHKLFSSCPIQFVSNSPNTTNKWSRTLFKGSNLWCSARLPPNPTSQFKMTLRQTISQLKDKWNKCIEIAAERNLVILEFSAPNRWTLVVPSCSISVSWPYFHAAALEDVWLFLFPRLVTMSLTHVNTWANRIRMLSSSKKLFNECTTKFTRDR